MNKTELVNSVAEQAGISKKDADKAVAAVVDTVVEALKAGDKVALVGFGTFEVHTRNARTGLNPRTKEKITCPPCKAPAFKAGSALKEAVNK